MGVSLATFVPSSALWWGAYGAYQRLLGGVLLPVEHTTLLRPVQPPLGMSEVRHRRSDVEAASSRPPRGPLRHALHGMRCLPERRI